MLRIQKSVGDQASLTLAKVPIRKRGNVISSKCPSFVQTCQTDCNEMDAFNNLAL